MRLTCVRSTIGFVIAIALFTMGGCRGLGVSPAGTSTPPTATLTATPTSTSSGQSTVLQWTTTNATSVSIDNGIGTVPVAGSVSVTPTQTTTYTLTATNGAGTATAQVTVLVQGSSGVTVTLTANPTSIAIGASSTLTWSSQNASTVSIDNGIGTVAASGTQQVSPTATTTYTITATGADGKTTATATATVTVGAAPTVTITATPTSVAAGQSSTLTVTATSATQVVITNNNDSTSTTLGPTGGTATVSPQATTTYTATASNGAGVTATATATVTVAASSINSIEHIVFMMEENRTFDTYFGMLNPYRQANGFTTGDDGVTYKVDGIEDKLSTISNESDDKQVFSLFHTSSSCLEDMTSSWTESYGDVDRYNFTGSRAIAMDGFVHTAEGFSKTFHFTDTAGQRAMAYYMDTSTSGAPELNYYYYMASQFALSDRWFSPVSGKTIPNRIATMSGGTTQGYVMDPGSDDHAPSLTAKTIFQLLDENNVSWKIYYTTTGSDGSPATTFTYFTYAHRYVYKDTNGDWVIDNTHIAPLSQYFTDLQNGTLPQFAWIEVGDTDNDEHPGATASILSGQQRVSTIINGLMGSTSWPTSVFFLAFDEGGGPYDHVPPVPGQTNKYTSADLAPIEGDVQPIAVNPDSYNPCVPATPGDYTHNCDLRPDMPGTSPNDVAAQQGFAAQIGFRVPNFVISPFSRKHFVNHTAMDHTAIVRFVEQRFGLSPLTARDAAQPALDAFFDFTNSPWMTPPTPPTPPPVGSTCHASQLQ